MEIVVLFLPLWYLEKYKKPISLSRFFNEVFFLLLSSCHSLRKWREKSGSIDLSSPKA